MLAFGIFQVWKQVNGISGQVMQLSGQVIFGNLKVTSPGQMTLIFPALCSGIKSIITFSD